MIRGGRLLITALLIAILPSVLFVLACFLAFIASIMDCDQLAVPLILILWVFPIYAFPAAIALNVCGLPAFSQSIGSMTAIPSVLLVVVSTAFWCLVVLTVKYLAGVFFEKGK